MAPPRGRSTDHGRPDDQPDREIKKRSQGGQETQDGILPVVGRPWRGHPTAGRTRGRRIGEVGAATVLTRAALQVRHNGCVTDGLAAYPEVRGARSASALPAPTARV